MSPEVVLFSRSYGMAPNPLGVSSLNPLHFPCILCLPHRATDKLPSISVVSHGIDLSPRQTTKKCNSKIWLEDPTPKRILTKWCRCLPGSHFGKSYRIKFKKIWRATNMHVCLLLGPTMKRSLVLVLFTFKKRPKERERNQCFKIGKHISDTKGSLHCLSEEWSWPITKYKLCKNSV